MIEGSRPHISNTKMFLIRKKFKEHRPWACNSMPKECLPYGFLFLLDADILILSQFFFVSVPGLCSGRNPRFSELRDDPGWVPHVAGCLWM